MILSELPTTPVRFLLNGEPIEVSGIAPQVTLLQYLREHRGLTGTKEGCAEGDCGACTVVCATASDVGGLQFRPINACIRLLPTMDGLAIFTVESLRGPGSDFHPVQQALIDSHGSQCGFCTPGFVMSLFGLYKNAYRPSRAAIEEALSGNLCRCTGYRPIIDAAQRMFDLAPQEGWRGPGLAIDGARSESAEEAAMATVLRGMARQSTFGYAAAGQRFFAPRSVRELTALSSALPDAVVVAGSTDLALQVTKQGRDLGDLIYVGAIRQLTGIAAGPETIDIGAAALLADVVPALEAHWPELHECWIRFASVPVRNAATLGGNLMNGSPIGDGIPVLLALGASLELASEAGVRELPIDDFYLGYRTTARRPGEVLTRMRVPLRLPGSLVRAYKISKRWAQDISAVFACFRLDFDGATIVKARIGVGGMSAVVSRAPATEAALTGRTWNENTAFAAATILAGEFAPISDMRASADYRRTVLSALLQRCWLESSARPSGAPVRVTDLSLQDAPNATSGVSSR